MPEHAEDEHAMLLSDIPQEVLEMGTIAHLLAHRESIFLYRLLNITPACYRDPVARRVYQGVVQGILSSHNYGISIPVENLNIGETDLSYLRRAISGGFPCSHSLPACLIELHDRTIIQLEEEADIDEEWQQLSQEYVPDDPGDDMPW